MRLVMDMVTLVSNWGWKFLSWRESSKMPYLLEEATPSIFEAIIE